MDFIPHDSTVERDLRPRFRIPAPEMRTRSEWSYKVTFHLLLLNNSG
jgi:hypothetical protein